MPIEIKVTPPGLTMSQGRTFMVTDAKGEINPHSSQGVYLMDTRFVSSYTLYVSRQPWKLVNSSQITFFSSRIFLTNPALAAEDGDLAENTLGLTIDRYVDEGIHEDFSVTNYSGKQVRIILALDILCDFADLFEVRAQRFVERGQLSSRWNEQERSLRTSYTNQDFHRALIYQVSRTDVPIDYANGRILFEIELEPGQERQTSGEMMLEHGQEVKRPRSGYQGRGQFKRRVAPLQAHGSGSTLPRHNASLLLLTPNEHVYRMYRQSIEDMAALRIYDLDVSEHEWVPAAGVPWFVTLFGRDSLIVSLQTMMLSSAFARGVLKRLAEYQASERDDYRDAQPGKILHEMRSGELAHFHAIPHTPYYGTADATILYLIALSETYRWTGDVKLLQQYRPVIDACLYWIDAYGDLDGDGFQEYQTYSSRGYENMGWKDAGDAVVYADGSQVKQPKALCELQGYVYDAKMRMAEVFAVLGDEARARQLLQQAETLKQHFNAAFWMEEEGCYAFGLDPQKHQITSIASNAGHCLWSGIADQARAEQTARRLLQDDMFSGWGIRTLSRQNPAYNPFSYHLGSVWPHDNSIIAAGFKRYGLVEEATKVIRAIFDAARRFDAYQLPEIFAGLSRKDVEDFPALYPPGANIPQAWASGSIFQMVQTIFGLRADAPHQRLYVHPTLPTWLSEVVVQHVQVGPCEITLHFWREKDGHSRWEVASMSAREGTAAEEMISVMDEPGTSHG